MPVVNTEDARGKVKAVRQEGSTVADAYEAFPDALESTRH
jgi:hypothetical protein